MVDLRWKTYVLNAGICMMRWRRVGIFNVWGRRWRIDGCFVLETYEAVKHCWAVKNLERTTLHCAASDVSRAGKTPLGVVRRAVQATWLYASPFDLLMNCNQRTREFVPCSAQVWSPLVMWPVFPFLFKAWQISTIRSPVGLKPRLAHHAAVCSASARHLTHFSFIPTSGAVCLDLTPRACLRYSLRGCDTICDSCSSWRHHERRNISSSSIWCLKWCYRCSKKINPVCLLLIFSLYLYLFAHTSYLTGGLN